MADAEQLKQQLCEFGRRAYDKGLVAASDGNLSVRLDQDQILCSPTSQCKGFLKPEDICTVDLDGNHIAGDARPTSEIRLHLEVYRRRSDVNSVIHTHAPHVTAFAICGKPIPSGILAEPEVFLGEVPTAKYAIPGSEEFAKTIVPFVKQTNAIVLANHGMVSYERDLERAFWLTEILDAYCRTLILAANIGEPVRLSEQERAELKRLRRELGFVGDEVE